MIINRHNYEEFFLLYTDKELDADEQTAVESFARQNPDLAKELEMLQQSILKDDNIQFTQKELLYKKEKGISLTNYEEYFLLYADNELNEQEVAETDHFVLKHPQLQNEFTLLQQIKLEPELIEFAGKEKLYRQEKKIRRVIPMIMVRAGAAAAIAGIIYISFIVFYNNSTDSKMAIATVEKSARKVEKDDSRIIQKSVTEKPFASSDVKKESKNNSKKDAVTPGKYNPETIKKIKNDEKTALVNKPKNKLKEETVTADKNIAIAKTTIDEQVYSAPEEPETKLANDNSKIVHDPYKNGTVNVMVKQTIVGEQPALASHVVYLETDSDEEEKSIYISSAEINKNKLKGLFKKAAGFLNKKIRQNDN